MAKIQKVLADKFDLEEWEALFCLWETEKDKERKDMFETRVLKASRRKIFEDVKDECMMREDIITCIMYIEQQKSKADALAIYRKLYEQASTGNVQASKQFIDYQKELFKDEKQDSLSDILDEVDID